MPVAPANALMVLALLTSGTSVCVVLLSFSVFLQLIIIPAARIMQSAASEKYLFIKNLE
jgi:hypothetical protein